MAHRILKCTVCGGDHSIFHCENKCGVCHGENRKCSCSEQPPSKKKKSRKQKQSSGDQQSVADLRKLYDNLQKEHERVGSAFQNLKDQNEELARHLAEREADLEELTNLVSTKDEVIKNTERRLLHAKKLIADLKAEVQSLRSRNDQQEPEQQRPQQQSEAEIGRVNSHSLSSIHSRYAKVLQVIDDNRCSIPSRWMSEEYCPGLRGDCRAKDRGPSRARSCYQRPCWLCKRIGSDLQKKTSELSSSHG